MDTVLKLSYYGRQIGSDIRIIGIPKTIDNDLCCTDHTPGFGSAAKYIASTSLEIAHDTFIYAVKSVTIVEKMYFKDALPIWLHAQTLMNPSIRELMVLSLQWTARQHQWFVLNAYQTSHMKANTTT